MLHAAGEVPYVCVKSSLYIDHASDTIVFFENPAVGEDAAGGEQASGDTLGAPGYTPGAALQ